MTEKEIKILLVEDDPLIIDIYKTKFESEGFQVDVADTGEKAIEKALEAAKQGDPYDLVVLDIILPYLSGIEVLERLRSFEETKSLKVVMFTNVDASEFQEKAQELGVEEFWVKAYFDPSQVVESIKRILGVTQ